MIILLFLVICSQAVCFGLETKAGTDLSSGLLLIPAGTSAPVGQNQTSGILGYIQSLAQPLGFLGVALGSIVTYVLAPIKKIVLGSLKKLTGCIAGLSAMGPKGYIKDLQKKHLGIDIDQIKADLKASKAMMKDGIEKMDELKTKGKSMMKDGIEKMDDVKSKGKSMMKDGIEKMDDVKSKGKNLKDRAGKFKDNLSFTIDIPDIEVPEIIKVDICPVPKTQTGDLKTLCPTALMEEPRYKDFQKKINRSCP